MMSWIKIGRAGRDGLPSYCTMWCSDADFTSYHDDFYLGGLSASAKEATIQSIQALRNFAFDVQQCRRASILKFFKEKPAFGERCGTCDVCVNYKKFEDDSVRDFSLECKGILIALASLKPCAMSVIEKVLRGNIVEKYRYKKNPEQTKLSIQTARNSAPKMPFGFWKEFLPLLVQNGYVKKSNVNRVVGGYSRTYAEYAIEEKGLRLLNDSNSTALRLPVPTCVRDFEAAEKARVEATLAKLKESGVDMKAVPKKELDNGDGEVIRAHTQWIKYLESLERREDTKRLQQMKDLKSRIVDWRQNIALKKRLAPSTVMPEHLIAKIAYTSSKGPLNENALHAAGVRVSEGLVDVLDLWFIDTGGNGYQEICSNSSQEMIFPERLFNPKAPRKHAVYKPNKKTGMAFWESSYIRYMNGEHPDTIAINPANGRSIQVATVVGHIASALELGKTVDLARLKEVQKFPNKDEWVELLTCESDGKFDVTSGEKLSLGEFLAPIMGDEFSSKDYKERTPEESAKFSKWCSLSKWFFAFRRVDYNPHFEEIKKEMINEKPVEVVNKIKIKEEKVDEEVVDV